MPVVRELISRFGFKVDKKDFNKAEEGFKKLKTAATAIVGVLVAGKVANAIKGTVAEVARAADTFDKMSKRIGISTQVLQEYEFVAGLAGTSLGEFEVAIRRLQLSVDEASQGSKEYADEFKRLGINTKGANGQLKSAEELLPEMGDAMRRLKTDTERTAVAQKLLGRSGTSLIPVLMQGTDEINKQRQEARKLGFIDDELIEYGVEWTDTQLRLQKALMIVKNTIAKALLPGMIKTGKAIIEWVKANKEWIKLKVGAVIKRLASFIGNLARLAINVARSFYDWAKSLDPLSSRLLKIGVIAAGLAALLMLPAGPLILLIGLILLIIEDLEVMGKGGESASGKLITAFQKWFDETGGALGAFVDLWKWQLHLIFEYGKMVFGLLHDAIRAVIDFIIEDFKVMGGKILQTLRRLPGAKLLLGGGAAAPAPVARASPRAGGSQVMSSPRTTVNVSVQAKTGASPEEIGTVTAGTVDEVIKKRNREALTALTQGVASVVPGG